MPDETNSAEWPDLERRHPVAEVLEPKPPACSECSAEACNAAQTGSGSARDIVAAAASTLRIPTDITESMDYGRAIQPRPRDSA